MFSPTTPLMLPGSVQHLSLARENCECKQCKKKIKVNILAQLECVLSVHSTLSSHTSSVSENNTENI